jgi:hypothetical protein
MIVIKEDELATLIKNAIEPILKKLEMFENLVMPPEIKGDEAAGKFINKSAGAIQKMRERNILILGIHYHKVGRDIIYVHL